MKSMPRILSSMGFYCSVLLFGSLAGHASTVAGEDYCSSRGLRQSWEWIDGVSVGEIDNTGSGAAGYSDFTDLSTLLQPGADHEIGLTPGFRGIGSTVRWFVYIDLDQNKEFEVEELLLSASSREVVSGTLSIPLDAAAGDTRMRVIMTWSGTPGPCATFPFGEVEDYTVSIESPEPDPEPEDCDELVSGEISFSDFQAVLDSAEDINEVAGIKVCLAAGARVLNPEGAASSALKITRDNLLIVGNPSAPAVIENLRTDGGLWDHTGLVVEKSLLVELGHLTIRTSGQYGYPLMVFGSQVETLHDLSLIAEGDYTSGIRINPVGHHGLNYVAPAIGSMINTSISALGSLSDGLTALHGSRIGDIVNLSIEADEMALLLLGTEVKSLRDFSFVTGKKPIYLADVTIGSLRHGDIQMGGNATALSAYRSSIWLIDNISVVYTGSESPSGVYNFGDCQLGDIRNMSYSSSVEIEDYLYLFSRSLVALFQFNTGNGQPAKYLMLNDSIIEEER